VALLEEAVTAAPMDSAVIQPVASAMIQLQRPDLVKRALAILESAVGVLGKSASFQHDLAVAYMVNGRVEEALAAMQRAGELDPRNPLYPERLSQVYLETGRRTEADRWAKDAEKRKRDAEARFQYQIGD
jgi:predicted Zn-dependent protease